MHKPPRAHALSWLGDEMLQVLMLYVAVAMVDIAVLEVMGAKADCTHVEPICKHDMSHV